MKRLPLFLFFLSALALRAADSVPLFNATLTVGKDHRFVLVDAAGKASSFLRIGDEFAGYTIKAYGAKTGELELECAGKVFVVTLVADATGSNAPALATPATAADAEAVLNAMNFERMMEKTMAGVRKQQGTMIDRMMGQFQAPGVEREAVVALQKRMLDEIMSALNFNEMKGEVAKVYADVFSKEQLQSLGAFYASPTGQIFSDKQPEVAEKMNALMIPRVMAAMPKVQQIAKEFAEEQKVKRAAAAGSATPAMPPKP
ncbi:MAG: DUF2059 domain-containing protein [Verrucomicrobiota bacterium]|jgi:hypothetical protein